MVKAGTGSEQCYKNKPFYIPLRADYINICRIMVLAKETPYKFFIQSDEQSLYKPVK